MKKFGAVFRRFSVGLGDLVLVVIIVALELRNVALKGKQSPNVKLAGDGTDKKVFSIDLTYDSIKEKKILASPVKMPVKTPVAVKENVATNKPPLKE